jgi:hypothetical protein
VARRGGAWPRQLLQLLTAVVLLLVVFKLTGWLDRRLSTLPPLIELLILLGAGAGGLALYLAARRRRTRERARSVPAAGELLAPSPSPLPRAVVVPAVAAPPPRSEGATPAADRVGSHRPSEVPATDPYAELTSSMARAASALEDAAGVLETVTRTCASVLERIEDNRRDTFEAADAVAQFLSCPDARAETASSHPHATATEPR